MAPLYTPLFFGWTISLNEKVRKHVKFVPNPRDDMATALASKFHSFSCGIWKPTMFGYGDNKTSTLPYFGGFVFSIFLAHFLHRSYSKLRKNGQKRWTTTKRNIRTRRYMKKYQCTAHSKVCDVIFRKLAKHIMGYFSGFFLWGPWGYLGVRKVFAPRKTSRNGGLFVLSA